MKKVVLIVYSVIFCVGGFSQSAQKVSDMVSSQTVSLLDVAYIAATYLNIVESTTSEEYSLNALERYSKFPKIKDVESALSYKDFAYFCTQVWDIKGGLFLRITNSPRYAFTHLQSMNIINPHIQPNDAVTGSQALAIMTKLIEYSEQHATIDLQQYVKMPMKFHIYNR